MSTNENQKIELFEEFYEWLKTDGLKPKKSERLHKRKIFASLLASDKMTIDNFNDFLKDRNSTAYIKQVKEDEITLIGELIGKKIKYKSAEYEIKNMEFLENEFLIITEKIKMKIPYEKFEEIKKEIII
ncbi:hypothetical protein [Halarcobacter anaerophilus]|uniref:Uncharacterized protein n=1 Tax=Halarcobacter anaerophilus TaxID=877500 RepID=A0A4Q0Y3Q3_9BACT|nr:hypothetical protein [Halarcobacter anaerophilus]QDF29919.1 hypothetical protein AANAER_2463 [Halarcobacter anaerophilus]RXJ62881.1 hypothetical protein CRV06_08585 [Halarcobacter anaerophilus]